jgi:hypothetical protein
MKGLLLGGLLCVSTVAAAPAVSWAEEAALKTHRLNEFAFKYPAVFQIEDDQAAEDRSVLLSLHESALVFTLLELGSINQMTPQEFLTQTKSEREEEVKQEESKILNSSTVSPLKSKIGDGFGAEFTYIDSEKDEFTEKFRIVKVDGQALLIIATYAKPEAASAEKYLQVILDNLELIKKAAPQGKAAATTASIPK